jgi:pimeloyl-ACP methyl ester carboxylesterase
MAFLGPLQDQGGLLNIAGHLWRARERLHLRTGQNLPTAGQLAVALRMYILAEDRRRAGLLPDSDSGGTDGPETDASDPEAVSGVQQSHFEGRPSERQESSVELEPSHERLDAAIPQHSSDLIAIPDPAQLTIEHLFGQVGSEVAPDSAARTEPSPGGSRDSVRDRGDPKSVQRLLAKELRHYLLLADSAYASSEAEASDRLAFLGGTEALLEARWSSASCHPGYCIVKDELNSTIVVAVRGSKQVADFMTNLSCDTDPFMSGYGHSGMVQSARNLAGVLRSSLFHYMDSFKPKNGLVFVGHSLGGAVAALLSLMIRTNSFEENAALGTAPPANVLHSMWSSREISSASLASSQGRSAGRILVSISEETIRSSVSRTQCFTFGSPPCVSPDLALRMKSEGIHSFILGLDMVPRLSVASLDRFLVAVSRYDWSLDATQTLEHSVSSIASPVLGAAGAATAASLVAQYAPAGLAWMANSAGSAARRALSSQPPRQPSGSTSRTVSTAQGLSPAWKIALTATVVASSVLSHQFFREEPPHAVARANRGNGGSRQPDYSFARAFGMSVDDVERALMPSDPQELRVPGRVFHLDRPSRTSSSPADEDTDWASVQIVERNADSFLDVEASVFMIHDHHPPNIAQVLDQLL